MIRKKVVIMYISRFIAIKVIWKVFSVTILDFTAIMQWKFTLNYNKNIFLV